jgi:hypothetical protein
MKVLTTSSHAVGTNWTQWIPEIRDAKNVLNDIIGAEEWKKIRSRTQETPYSEWYRAYIELNQVPAMKIRVYDVIE